MNEGWAAVGGMLLAIPLVWNAARQDAADSMVEPALGQGMMVGEVGTTSAILQTRLTAAGTDADGDLPGAAGVACFVYWKEAGFGESTYTPWQEATAADDYIIKAVLRDLAPATQYHYRVIYGADRDKATAGQVDSAGTFTTHPGATGVERTSFVVVTGMNYAKFHQRAEEEGLPPAAEAALGYPALVAMGALQPDFFVATGDNVYYDHPRTPRARTAAEMRRKWHEQLLQPRFIEFFAHVPTYWEKDDHDHRFNDCDRDGDNPPTSDLGIRLFREQVPVTDPGDPAAVTYRTLRVSRDLQLWFLEGRDYRSRNSMEDGPDKTLWGAEQRAWLQRTLLASTATFKLVISPTPLVGPDDAYKRDNHTNAGGFRHEGRGFLTWAVDHGLRERGLFFVCGDRHWQYHAIDPTGLQEFSTGALVDANARLGRKPGTKGSTDPEGEIVQSYTSREPSGGFLHVVIEPSQVHDAALVRFAFHDETGETLYAFEYERPREGD